MTGPLPPEVAHLPVCPRRGLPIPYIAEVAEDGTGHFTVLDNAQAIKCLHGRLCAMCSLPMGEEVALLGDVASLEPGGFWIEPPVHERCAELAAGGLCPFISRRRVPRRPVPADVSVVGTERDRLAEVGRTVAKRPWIVAITREYAPALMRSDRGGEVVVYVAASPILRVRRYTWDAAGRLAEVPAAPPRATVRAQPRRKQPRRRRR